MMAQLKREDKVCVRIWCISFVVEGVVAECDENKIIVVTIFSGEMMEALELLFALPVFLVGLQVWR